MGRYLLRRSALAFVLLGAVVTGSLEAEAPASPRRSAGDLPVLHGETENLVATAPPRQNHAPPKVWSVDVEERPELASWITWWSSPQGLERLERTLERSRLFMGQVEVLLAEAGLPPELAVIPVVESAWRLDAVSSSGAVGPWQFLTATARGRDLVIDAWTDERRNVWMATQAACRELAFYKRMHGDWLLAIASYNGGPTRIRQLREQTGADDFWTLLDSGVLPRETASYVPQVLAVAWVKAHAGRLGLPIIWETPTDWEEIIPSKSLLLADLADITGVDLSTMERIHAELNLGVTPPPGRNYPIRVPTDTVDTVKTWLSALEEAELPGRFWRYTVRTGDTLSQIAVDAHLSVAALLHYNAQVRGRPLRAGERLLIPGDQRPPQAESDEVPQWSGRYRVQAGDSLWTIARNHGVTPEQLADANHRPMDAILGAGSVLSVPLPEEMP